MRFIVRIGCGLLLALLASSCTGSVQFSLGSQSASEAATDLIESDAMSQRLMVDSITEAVCEEPLNEDPDTVFACTGQSGASTIDFEVTIEEDDRIFAAPTNVVVADRLDRYESEAVEALSEVLNIALPGDAIDCGTESFVLGDDQQMICAITNPATNEVLDAAFTVSDVSTGRFTVVIVDPNE